MRTMKAAVVPELGAKLDAKGGPLHIAPLDVRRVCQVAVQTFQANASAKGIDLRFDSSGLTLDTQSVATLLSGGVVFDLPGSQTPEPRAADGAAFALAANRTEAMRRADDGPAASVRMRFNGSVRGLSPISQKNAPIRNVTATRLMRSVK